MIALRGISASRIKMSLREQIRSANFFETSKAAQAARYAKGKMSMGTTLEAQAFLRIDIQEFAALLRSTDPRRAV